MKTGWPESVLIELQPFFNRQNELTFEEDCAVRNKNHCVSRFTTKNETHAGMIKMKTLER